MEKQFAETKLNLDLSELSTADNGVNVSLCKNDIVFLPPQLDAGLTDIEKKTELLERKYGRILKTDVSLSRGLVSFQANKKRSVYRWYKFKEAFSADLVEHLLETYKISGGLLLDPFAGSGTTLFASSNIGLSSEGIELLPVGHRIISTKKLIDAGIREIELATIREWATTAPWREGAGRKKIPELRITKGAYPSETVESIEKFLYCLDSQTPRISSILLFALLCILESISFTRKDGQYLRWDHRSGRRSGTRPFNKGHIPSFDKAMSDKLSDIAFDLSNDATSPSLFPKVVTKGDMKLREGSCLEILPCLNENRFDCIITSPPYCNRYDYTRTYALELALLGVDEMRLSGLRQEMLSCTVENRAKDLIGINSNWQAPVNVAQNQELLQTILRYFEHQKDLGKLNNNGIPRMVAGYFYEMACVIYECHRVLKPGGKLMMVNDNVRYVGASIPVDLILSDIAASLGFLVEQILVLPNGKGNSSQQMGLHGRDRLRKCVYVWSKP